MKTFEQLQQEYPSTLFQEHTRKMVKDIQDDAIAHGHSLLVPRAGKEPGEIEHVKAEDILK